MPYSTVLLPILRFHLVHSNNTKSEFTLPWSRRYCSRTADCRVFPKPMSSASKLPAREKQYSEISSCQQQTKVMTVLGNPRSSMKRCYISEWKYKNLQIFHQPESILRQFRLLRFPYHFTFGWWQTQMNWKPPSVPMPFSALDANHLKPWTWYLRNVALSKNAPVGEERNLMLEQITCFLQDLDTYGCFRK